MAHFAFKEDKVYEIIQGPQKFDWFLALVDRPPKPSSRKTDLTVRDKELYQTQDEQIRIEITSLTQCNDPKRVRLRFEKSLQIDGIHRFVTMIGSREAKAWSGHDWYFKALLHDKVFDGVYSTQTRKGFIKLVPFSLPDDLQRRIDEMKEEEALVLQAYKI